MNKYWFGFKVKGGSAIACGPYKQDEINKERNRAKAPDAEISTWFIADSEEEAQERAAFFLRDV
jgi:hypothetical protein